MKRSIFLCCLLFAACSSQKQVDDKKTESQIIDSSTVSKQSVSDFQDFYTSFRKSIIENDSVELINSVRFPLKIKGYEDNDPVLSIDSNLFWIAFNEVLNITYYRNEEDTGTILKDLIRKENDVMNLPYYSEDGEDYRDFGNLDFRKIEGQWKLTSMYLNSKEFNKKK